MEFWLFPVLFDFSNSYIWFEFYNALLPKDVTLISDVSSFSLFFPQQEVFTTLIKEACIKSIHMFAQDVASSLLLCLQSLRSWHIVGCLGGCNSMNMQV
jgi:hypothetical protein